MDNAVETKSVPNLKPVGRVGLFSRFGMMAAILGCFVIGAMAFAATRSKLQAQSEMVRAREAAIHAAERQPNVSTGGAGIPSPSFSENSRPTLNPYKVESTEQSFVPVTNQFTGVTTYQLVRNTPVGGLLPRDFNAKHAFDADLAQLARQYRNAPPSNRESISKAITQKLTEVFEARHQEQVSRAEKLRTELQQTEELLDKRAQLKPKIIERRLKELTGQQDELSWNPQVVDNNQPVVSSGLPVGGLQQMNSITPAGQPMPLGLPSGLSPTQPEILPIPNSMNSAIASTPSLPTPLESGENPLAANLPSPSQLTSPSENEAKTDTSRSFMAAGFKLKKLMRQFEEAKQKLGNAHPQLVSLQNVVDETKTVWDFERQTLLTELEAIESELAVVQKQRDLSIDQQKRQNALFANGSISQEDLSNTERNVLNAERDLLQVRFKIKSAKNAIEWANDFEEKFFKTLQKAPANLE